MITAVFDCVVYVQAVLSRRGPASLCPQLAEAEHVTLFLSLEIIDEIKRTLDKPSLRVRFPRSPKRDISESPGENLGHPAQSARPLHTEACSGAVQRGRDVQAP